MINSIINSIQYAYKTPDLLLSKIAIGKERVKSFLSWEQVFDKILKTIKKYQKYLKYLKIKPG